MRKQLRETQMIDRYILNTMSHTGRLVFQARMILQPDLKEKLRCQRETHAFLQWASRQQKKEELTSLYSRLMRDMSFSRQVTSIFTPPA